MQLTYVQKMVIVVVAVGLVLAIPVYVVACMAFQRTTTQDTRVTNIEGREERYITSVSTTLLTPSSYVDVAVKFEYYYKKSEHKVRLVVSLPDGYPYSASDTSDSSSVTAYGILPLWAMTLDENSSVQPGTYLVKSIGYFGDIGDTVSYLIMSLENSNATDPQGTWALNSDTDSITSASIWLGQEECWYSFSDDLQRCFADEIGELKYRLTTAVDIAAWDAQYDALN